MAEHDLDRYLDDRMAFDALSEEEQARLFTGHVSTGETDARPLAEADAAPGPDGATEDGDEAPGVAATRQRGIEHQPDEAVSEGGRPTVLARDGRHTIPYEALLDARERARRMEDVVREQSAMIERMRRHPPHAAEAPQPESDVDAASMTALESKEREYLARVINGDPEGAVRVRGEINAEIRRQTEQEVSARALEQSARVVSLHEAQRLLQEAAQRTLATYPYLNDNEVALAEVVEWRDFYMMKGVAPHQAVARAAEKVAPAWRPLPSAAEVERKASRAAAPGRTPLSLSDMPAATASPHDEVAAMREMSGTGLMQRFAGKSPEQIMELMNRLI